MHFKLDYNIKILHIHAHNNNEMVIIVQTSFLKIQLGTLYIIQI